MKISKKKGTAKWYKFESDGESCELCIRPFPHSRLAETDIRVGVDGQATVGLGIEWHRFDACLRDWRGIEDEDTGKEFAYNVINKKYLYDYDDNLRNFVIETVNKLDAKVDEAVKN
jgi:hypothetical protein